MVFVYKCNITLDLPHKSIKTLDETMVLNRLLAPANAKQQRPNYTLDKWWHFSKHKIVDPIILWYDVSKKHLDLHPGGTRLMGAALDNRESLQGLLICNRKAKRLTLEGIDINPKLFKTIDQPFDMQLSFNMWNFYSQYLGIRKLDEPWDNWQRMMSGVCNLGDYRVDLILNKERTISLNSHGNTLYKEFHIKDFKDTYDAVRTVLKAGDTIRDHLL